MFRNRTFLKILSLFIAVFLWVYVMGEVNPETKTKISNIEVSFINTDTLAERDLAVVQKKIITVDISIKGKRSDVNDTENNGLTAVVDVSDAEAGNNTGAIDINLPDGVSLDSMSAETIDYEVEDRIEKEVPVDIEFLGNGEQGELIPWLEEVYPETVTVSGAKSSVKKVNDVKGTVAKTVVTESSKSVDVALIPATSKGDSVFGLDLDIDNAQAKVRLMTIKTVDLDISPQNIGEDLEVEEISGANSVKIVGSADDLEELEKLDATIDLQGLTTKGKVVLNIDLPDNVYLYDQDKQPTAEVTLKSTR